MLSLSLNKRCRSSAIYAAAGRWWRSPFRWRTYRVSCRLCSCQWRQTKDKKSRSTSRVKYLNYKKKKNTFTVLKFELKGKKIEPSIVSHFEAQTKEERSAKSGPSDKCVSENRPAVNHRSNLWRALIIFGNHRMARVPLNICISLTIVNRRPLLIASQSWGNLVSHFRQQLGN